MVHKNTKIVDWQTPDSHFKQKKPDWYWGIGIVTVVGVVLSAVFSNYLLGFLILLAGVLVFIYSSREPEIIQTEISDQGIKVDEQFYPFTNLNAFWIKAYEESEQEISGKLILHADRWILPIITIPVTEDLELEDLREVMLSYLPEQQMEEPAITRITEKLGF